jgi:hypothetical protein
MLASKNYGTITYFGSASNPADNGLTNTSPVAVTPPATMKVGDLVLMFAVNREIQANITSIAISADGGQVWSVLGTFGGTGFDPPTVKVFYAIFNGTWAANPSVAFVTATPVNSVVMHVLRPSNVSNTFYPGVALSSGFWNDVTPPYTSTITGITPVANSNVTIVGWFAGAAVIWSALSGSGWVVLGSAQYRNIAGSDQSATFAYKAQSSPTATGNVTKTLDTTGGGVTCIFSFYEL